MQLYTMFVEIVKLKFLRTRFVLVQCRSVLSVGVLLPISAGSLLFIFALCKYCCQVKKDGFSKGD